MPHVDFVVSDRTPNSNKKEKLIVHPNGIKGFFKSFTGQSGDYWVSIIPSLNVSGYGITEEDAIADLKANCDFFWTSMFSVDEFQRSAELRKLGWEVDKIFKKRFSKSYVDSDGVLQNFDYPELVKSNLLEAV